MSNKNERFLQLIRQAASEGIDVTDPQAMAAFLAENTRGRGRPALSDDEQEARRLDKLKAKRFESVKNSALKGAADALAFVAAPSITSDGFEKRERPEGAGRGQNKLTGGLRFKYRQLAEGNFPSKKIHAFLEALASAFEELTGLSEEKKEASK
jgi:hypothetical protein